MERTVEIVGEQLLKRHGSLKRVRRYLKGWRPELGALHQGWQGQETIVEEQIIGPLAIFEVSKIT